MRMRHAYSAKKTVMAPSYMSGGEAILGAGSQVKTVKQCVPVSGMITPNCVLQAKCCIVSRGGPWTAS